MGLKVTDTVPLVPFAHEPDGEVVNVKLELCVPLMEMALVGLKELPLLFVTVKLNAAELDPTFVSANVLDDGVMVTCACTNVALDKITRKATSALKRTVTE